ncbi:hypothetical protein Hanom_Chr16g01418291 [Helianthus anomalus]
MQLVRSTRNSMHLEDPITTKEAVAATVVEAVEEVMEVGVVVEVAAEVDCTRMDVTNTMSNQEITTQVTKGTIMVVGEEAAGVMVAAAMATTTMLLGLKLQNLNHW